MKNISVKSLVVSIVLILSAVLATGCAFDFNIPMPTQSAPTTAASTATPITTTPNTSPIDAKWKPPATDGLSTTLPDIADIVAKVKPSVVAINTETTTLDFFNRPLTQEGAGSGWIIDKNGIIITNNHVVEGAKSITVTLDDGRTFQVDMSKVAIDKQADLAVLKIDAANLPAATVGDSNKLRVGDWVVAIGNALGEGISATHGIVSRNNVSISLDQGQSLSNLIQTNAAINPGNSGGPLVDLAGEVIGITSAKLSAVGVEGMGYAISTNEAMPIIQALITKGYVVRPWLGISFYPVDAYVVWRYNLPVSQGALLTDVYTGSPADTAGLKAGDVITKFGSKEITDVDQLTQAIQSSQVGQTISITYWRGNSERTTQATMVESPPPS